MVVFDKKKTQEVIKEKGKIEGNSLPFEYLLIFKKKNMLCNYCNKNNFLHLPGD